MQTDNIRPPQSGDRPFSKAKSLVCEARKNFSIFAICMVVLTALLGLTQPVFGQSTGQLVVELNKVEASDTGGCSAFFLFRNGTDNSFEGFEMSLAILDTNGVIDRLLSTDAAPLPVARTTLKLF